MTRVGVIVAFFAFVSCHDRGNIMAKYVIVIKGDEFNRMRESMMDSSIVSIDYELNEYIFRDRQLSLNDLYRQIQLEKNEVILLSSNTVNWDKSIKEFLNEDIFHTIGLQNLKTVENLEQFKEIDGDYLFARSCEVQSVVARIKNTPENRLYLSPSVRLSEGVDFIKVYFVKSISCRD